GAQGGPSSVTNGCSAGKTPPAKNRLSRLTSTSAPFSADFRLLRAPRAVENKSASPVTRRPAQPKLARVPPPNWSRRMEVAILVPLIFFASIVLIIATPFYFRHRNRRVIYEALKTSVEKTGAADPKLVDAITHDQIGPNGDLRRGVL